MPTDAPARGLTTAEVAARYRVGEDRVRGWIKNGALKAINTADAKCGRPRYVVLPEYLAEFERGRSIAPPPKTCSYSRACKPEAIDFFPD